MKTIELKKPINCNIGDYQFEINRLEPINQTHYRVYADYEDRVILMGDYSLELLCETNDEFKKIFKGRKI